MCYECGADIGGDDFVSTAEDGPRDRHRTTSAERVTCREDVPVLERINALVDADEYPNRSAAIREATRQFVDREQGVDTERDGDSDA
nr:ribbon-helix-helix domain-containing protein [Natrialba sp. INN-245]